MPGDNLVIVMASGTHFGDVFRIADLVQPGRYVVVKPVDKFIGFMTDPAAAYRDIRYAGTHPFEKRQWSEKRVFMTILAGRNIVWIFYGVSLFINFGMHTGR